MTIIAELVQATANFEATEPEQAFAAVVRLTTTEFGTIGRIPVAIQDPMFIEMLRAYVVSQLPTLSNTAGLPITMVGSSHKERGPDLEGLLVYAAANFEQPHPLPIFEATIQLVHPEIPVLERKIIPVTSSTVIENLRQFVESMLPIATAAIGIPVQMPPPQSSGTLGGDPPPE